MGVSQVGTPSGGCFSFGFRLPTTGDLFCDNLSLRHPSAWLVAAQSNHVHVRNGMTGNRSLASQAVLTASLGMLLAAPSDQKANRISRGEVKTVTGEEHDFYGFSGSFSRGGGGGKLGVLFWPELFEALPERFPFGFCLTTTPPTGEGYQRGLGTILLKHPASC